MRTTMLTVPVLLGVLVLTGCGGNGGDPATATGGQTEAPAGDAVLATADSDVGTIVVDGEGRTVYVFDEDTAGSGESACSGECLANWPPVVADDPAPTVDGVTADVGTIERDDGVLQVTLGGLPLYLFAGDAAAGDVNGQAVNDVWWVVGPDGDTISDSGPAPGSDGADDGSDAGPDSSY